MMPGQPSKGQRVWFRDMPATITRVDTETWIDIQVCDLLFDDGQELPSVPSDVLQFIPSSQQQGGRT